ncbi:MAG: cbb3-type cytochrome c oxidase subunit I [Gaiella sp.]
MTDGSSIVTEHDRRVARRLTLQYTIAATAVLAASGLLGALMRWSQAVPGARIGDNFWYAIMTAHGLGAFVGWAGFAVMGLAWVILAGVGFPTRGFGLVMARLTWWLMVLGVAGVVVTTLIMQFGGSWVFLYPLPFNSQGAWGMWTTGLFSFSVLLVGLAIVTWCFGILHTVCRREALHAVSGNIFKRYGLSMGLGYLWPKSFATNPKPVPYAVIPLAVIGLDMIIATLPLAGLLVWQILQSAGWVGSADILLAKNILWWFGHPVVYLLLFPAVAAYYYLIPRYAGRQLVAGNVIAIAWTVAVIANVTVWAHHIYLDYPDGSLQAQINTAMQPMTFSLVLPSALSLYSLAFTIRRSHFRWTAASTALFLGLVGWLLSGLSGIVNATIAFDVVVHNTLWIVGHFHHMAVLNIGLLIFGATYSLLPELTGKALYSERMAKWHVWVTFVAGMIVFGLWLVQGLDGAPRRFSVLPSEYDGLTRISLPFVFVLAAVQALYFVNIWQTLRGKAGVAVFDDRGLPVPAPKKEMDSHTWEAVVVMTALALIAAGGVAGWLIGRESSGDGGAPVTVTTGGGGDTETEPATDTGAAADPVNGKELFASSGCGGCHVLADAGATGNVGPSLDGNANLTEQFIVDRVTNGAGAMPGFADRLSAEEIADVTAYVLEAADR